MKGWLTVLFVTAAVFVADAVTKSWALSHLHEGVSEPFIAGLLQLTLTHNTGGAFGIGHQFKELMTLLPIAICAGIIYSIIQRERSGDTLVVWERIGFSLILGGALGNICDRLLRGRVTDFLDFAFMNFPVFNVADAIIDVGLSLVVLHVLLQQPKQERGSGNG